jgi:hypothetical protein
VRVRLSVAAPMTDMMPAASTDRHDATHFEADARRRDGLRRARVARSSTVVWCAHADGLVRIDVRGGRRLTLDGFGRRVWTALGRQPTLAQLIVDLRADGGSVERLAEDVTRLLARWRADGVIRWI